MLRWMILSHSLDGNYLAYGMDMSGVLKLAEVLPQTKLQTLRCLSATCSRSMLAPDNVDLFLHLPHVLTALSLHLQPQTMLHWRRGRHGGRCRAQGDADHPP